MTIVPMYFPSPPQGVWHLGPLPIRAYALFIIVGIVAALLIGDRRWEARGGQRGVIYDIALWTVPFGLVGGRLYHLATDWRTYWGPGGAGFGAALRIWDGGLGIWGAVALGGVGAWIGCRRRGIPLPAFADALAPGLVLAQAIGRLGNYFNQELYGRETTLPWGMEIFYRRDPSGFIDPHSLDGVSTGQVALIVQPTFLYELLWNLLIFVAVLYIDRQFILGHGRLFAIYVAGYCIGRFCVELLRDDTATHIAGIRINSFTSTFVFIGAVVYIILAPKGREDPASLHGTDYVDDESPEPEPEPEAEVPKAAEVAQAETVEAEAEEPEAEFETSDAEVSDAEVSEAAEAETVEPEAEEAVAEGDPGDDEEQAEQAAAETVEAEAEEPEAEFETSDAEVSDAEVSEAAEAETVEPEAGEAVAEGDPGDDEEQAEQAAAETVEAEAEEPEAEFETSDAEVSDAEVSEAAEAETVEPEAGEAVAEGDPGDDEEQAEQAAAESVEAEAEEPEAEFETSDAEESDAEVSEAAEAETVEPEAEEAVAEGDPGDDEEQAEQPVEDGEPGQNAEAQSEEPESAADEALPDDDDGCDCEHAHLFSADKSF